MSNPAQASLLFGKKLSVTEETPILLGFGGKPEMVLMVKDVVMDHHNNHITRGSRPKGRGEALFSSFVLKIINLNNNNNKSFFTYYTIKI